MLRLIFFGRQALLAVVLCGTIALMIAGCTDNSTTPGTITLYHQVNLASDVGGYNAAALDPNLMNPWGIAIDAAAAKIWVADNRSGVSTVYGLTGAVSTTIVRIPTRDGGFGGSPTGAVYNPTSNFVVPGSVAATYIFATEDGTISGWNAGMGDSATVIVKSDANSVYLGLELLGNSLFVANFKGNVVEMYDKDFKFVKSFTDPGIPSDYGPFNVKSIDGNLYVTYAKHDPATGEEAKGAGNGYVSVFDPTGTFIKQFASGGTLNAPWGMTVAPANFGSYTGHILIGNFGDGRISAFDLLGNYRGQLMNLSNKEIEIEGLWGLAIGPSPDNVYFTAGVADEQHGLFGVLGLH